MLGPWALLDCRFICDRGKRGDTTRGPPSVWIPPPPDALPLPARIHKPAVVSYGAAFVVVCL
jgi:hypothetical protein